MTNCWLNWHASTDWEDLQLFLPKAREAGQDLLKTTAAQVAHMAREGSGNPDVASGNA